jgi:hypothetical protein
MSGAQVPRRLGLWIPWALFAAVVLGWFGYWMVLKDQARARIEAVATDWRRSGGKLEWSNLTADGFPMRLSFRFTDLRIGARDGSWSVETSRASLHFNPTNPLHVIGAPDAPVTVTTSRGVATAKAAKSGFSLRFRANGLLARAAAEADGLEWAASSGAATLSRLLANLRPDPRDPRAVQIALEMDGLVPAKAPAALAPLGARVDRVRAALVVDKLNEALRRGAQGWAEAGGGLRIEAGELGWGPAKATATGKLTLDAQRRLAGTLTLTLADPRAALAPLAEAPGISGPARAALLKAADTPAPLALPLDLTSGVLTYAGVAPLVRFATDAGAGDRQ